MNRMLTVAFATLTLSSTAFGHPNGTYVIDDNESATVTFMVTGRCPTDVTGALRGSIRNLTFSEAAAQEPYLFVSGTYVEIHDENGEVYVQTNDQCVPLEEGEAIPATRNTFADYSLRRVQ